MAAEAKLRSILERFYPWLEGVNHVHLPGGEILYASEVRAALDEPAPRSLFTLCPTCQMPTMNCDCMPTAEEKR